MVDLYGECSVSTTSVDASTQTLAKAGGRLKNTPPL